MANKYILVAEDDQFLANLYKLNLENAGFDVELAIDGEEAIEYIEDERPALLLLDLLMPKLDGFGVLEHIKKKKYKIPIVVFSNLSEDMDEKKCRQYGIKDYFVKSDVDLEEMIGLVKKYLK